MCYMCESVDQCEHICGWILRESCLGMCVLEALCTSVFVSATEYRGCW